MTTGTFFSHELHPGWTLGVSNQIILEVANSVNARLLATREYIDNFSERDKAGAVLHIAEINDPQMVTSLMLEPFGFVPSSEKKTYVATTERKIDQLLGHPDHISSYQSRDAITLWGGAYLIARLKAILAISGLPELGDEAVGLGIGLLMRWIDLNYAVQIAKISDNFLFTALCPRLPNYPFNEYE